MPIQPVTDHKEILRWAKARNAVPVEVVPRAFDGEPAILRFVFGEVPEDQSEMRAISWESFFAQFDLLGLALAFDGGHQYELVQIEEKSAYRFGGKPV
jgi:hypothetical protein